MPRAEVNGVGLEYAEAGSGYPLLWCHELAGSMERWRAQVSFFSRFYRVITYNARGYPPSDVPPEPDSYSQDIAVADAFGLLKDLGIDEAHVGGLSMGGTTALNFGLQHPETAKSLIVAGARPERSAAPGPRFWKKTSELRASCLAMPMARSSFRLSVMLRLPRFSQTK